ncbi:unnamed protein product [Rotaria sordida]|uniref:Mitochondrial proton/calcium exchanger protein n=1 Tax=Rotaria sordida TaxID=392033 RepID=A0A818YKQ3_9BILA|nr:unnamed protein product [Rotaria sordida]
MFVKENHHLMITGGTIVPVIKAHSYYYIYDQHISSINSNRLLLLSLTHIRTFHSSAVLYNDKLKQEKPENLFEKDKINKNDAKQIGSTTNVLIVRPDASLITTTDASAIVKRKSLRQRFVDELKHYYNGTKLLFIETRIAFRLLRQVLNGYILTRRERKQFTRTVADLFRLVPFSVFIIVPFMEFTLPIFLKLFPNMLPSTFKEADKEKEKLKKQIKIKLEVAKFLQDTLEATALGSKKKSSNDALATQFVEFMKKIRSTGVQPSTEEIMKFSSLFEDNLTLDNLDRQQLVAVCKLIGISSIGPDYYLRFILHLKLRHLQADDKLIESEGIENLNVEELQAACRERGMRSYGISIERLRSQLQQWLDLHLNQRIPSTILLLSRSLYLPENISQENILKATIQSLPKAIDNVTAINLAKVSGERIHNTQRIEYIKHEDATIRKEREEKIKTKILNDDEIKKKKFMDQIVLSTTSLDTSKIENLVDNKALILHDMIKEVKKDESNIDVEQFETALEQLVNQKAKEVRNTVEEIRDLKTDDNFYKEDIKEFATLVATKQLKNLSETRSAKALSKRIDKLVIDLDDIVQTLDKKQDKLKIDIKIQEDTLKDQALLKSDEIQQHKDFLTEKRNMLISTQEFINTIRQIQKVSSQSTDAQLLDIIHQFDHNRDGFIEADEILKTLEIIGNEKIQISKKHLKEIIDLVRKEQIIEHKEKFEAKTKQQLIMNSVNGIEKTQNITKNI